MNSWEWQGLLNRLLRFSNVPGYVPDPPQKPVCRRFSRCEGCPYPAHGFLCWGSGEDCLRTRMRDIERRKNDYEHESSPL